MIQENKPFVYGIIGDNHQRLKIEFIQIEKNIQNPKEYFVYGISEIKNSKNTFVGKIEIDSIKKIISDNFGIDDSYKDSGIKYQGLLTGKYIFFEDQQKSDSGFFEGTINTLFYIDKDSVVRYNDIDFVSDGYFNNAFVGIWKDYNSDIAKRCNWGDFRVPSANCDFDAGAGEFRVSEEYKSYGWDN